ncbi:MAG TPA: polymer-forming cytoskeletal protein, partial [Chthoniobacterales bacterium]|nr:polymer-forming cytoskeletal protein [Chthoniobacterales bacterium]
MAPTPPPPQPPAAKPNPTPNGATDVTKGTLSSGVSIKGVVKFQKELLIDGEVDGRIDSQGRLTIGKSARIKGDIKTRSVVVDGNVTGN